MGGLSLQKTWLLVVVGGALIFAAGSNRTPLKLWVARGSVLVLALFAFFLAFSFAQEVSEESALIVFLAVGVPVFVALYSLSLLYLLFKSR